MQKLIWLMVPLIISLSGPASAEFYKYTDQNGNIRFTDDLSRVPEDQRPDVKSYEDAASTQPPALPAPRKASDQRSAEKQTASNTGLESQSLQIREKKDALDREYETLMKEKSRLENEAKKTKSKDEQALFNQKISNLNKEIAQYDQKRKALNAEIEDFNAKVAEKNKENQ